MIFAHRLLITLSGSGTLVSTQVLPVPASPGLSSLCDLSVALLEMRGSHLNFGSHALKLICARLSDDWEARYSHGLLLAETFIDPKRHRGTLYDAAGWCLILKS